ncbi:TniQ family protein [Kitasatospora cineracea]|uniref:TniQ family protein n=1 Tax=Kitasatospora cineracea TaxID=88074 RepID=UPI0034489794
MLVPQSGESFPSWLYRLAADLDVPPGQAALLLGFERRSGQYIVKPPFFGIALSQRAAERIRTASDLDPAELHAMHLSALDGGALDLTGLDFSFERSVQPVSLREWALFDSSRGCPKCLADSPVWPLWWRLSLAAVCPTHSVLLADRCSRCGVKLQRGTASTTPSLPSRGSTLSPHLCNARLPVDRRTAWTCDQVLGGLPAEAVPASLAESQKRLLEVAFSGRATAAGREVAASEYFAAFKYLTALVRVSASEDDLARVPPALAEVFAADLAERRRLRSGTSSAKLGVSPPSAAHAGALLALIEPVLSAPDQATCRRMLEPWLAEVTRQRQATGNNNLLRQIAQPPFLARLTAVAAPNAPRIIGLLPALERPKLLEPRHVPHLLGEADYARVASHFPAVNPLRGRRFASVALARLAGASTWHEAGQDLGLPDPDLAVQISGQLAGRIQDPDAFWHDLQRTAQVIEQRGLVDYRARHWALTDLTTVPADVLFPVMPSVGPRGNSLSPARRRHAAAWLWQHLTGGDVRDAPAHVLELWPGFQLASVRRSWQRFTELDAPGLPGALIAWGRELLLRKGCA